MPTNLEVGRLFSTFNVGLSITANEGKMTCLLCGKEFEITPVRKLFCGKSCAAKHKWKTNPKLRESVVASNKERVWLHCGRCGANFVKRHPDHKWCSERCGSLVRKQRYQRSPESKAHRARHAREYRVRLKLKQQRRARLAQLFASP
jgi:hypothetical protein